jgi:hypothetical protein
MGAWGTAVFSDDLAADLRGDFRELIGDGLTSTQAVDKLMAEYKSSLDDPDEASVFWIALASIQWNLGRLEERTKRKALRVIDSGQDLARWDDLSDRKKRAEVLQKVRSQLESPQPAPKRVPRTIKHANDWSVGEVIGFRLLSGKWVLMRVIGHHTDKGGKTAVCELLDWVGDKFPKAKEISAMSFMKEANLRSTSQFIFVEPRKKRDQSRVERLGIITAPAQKRGGYSVLVWPYVDSQLEEWFGLK